MLLAIPQTIPRSLCLLLIAMLGVGGVIYRDRLPSLQTLKLSIFLISNPAEKSYLVSQEELVAQLDNRTTPPIIIDVRTPEEYAAGHIPEAVNIPVQEIEQQLNTIQQLATDQSVLASLESSISVNHESKTWPNDDNQANDGNNGVVILYCERGIRASWANAQLQDAGIGTVLQLDGHMRAWRQKNRPIEHGVGEIEARYLSELVGAGNDTSDADNTGGTGDIGTISDIGNIGGTVVDDTDLDFTRTWIVNVAQATELIQQGATVLDAQGNGFGLKRFPNTQVVRWQQFSQPHQPYRGNLLDDDAQLTQQFQALGISRDRPVVVFGNPPHDWGEDGRIVWMLRTLGHPKAVIVDGGIQALLAAETTQLSIQPLRPGVASVMNNVNQKGDFVVERLSPQWPQSNLFMHWSIQKAQLKAQLDIQRGIERGQPNITSSANTIIIDTREPREYAGQTPYGEQRGGHIPGAVNLYFKKLLDESGYLKPRSEILKLARQYGITPNTSIVAYCTGGIRSAWLTVVLTHYGFQVRNYPGSMWEWSADPVTQDLLVAPNQG